MAEQRSGARITNRDGPTTARSGITRICLSVERANRARSLYINEGFTTVESGPDSDTMIKVVSQQ